MNEPTAGDGPPPNRTRDDYPAEFLLGILFYEEGDFFESHEVWESLWKATAGRDRDFFHGLIQVAVGLCHYYNGNMWGGRRMYERARSRLEGYRPRHQGLDVDRFLAELAHCFEPVVAADPMNPIPFDASTVPRITLDPPPTRWPRKRDWAGYD